MKREEDPKNTNNWMAWALVIILLACLLVASALSQRSIDATVPRSVTSPDWARQTVTSPVPVETVPSPTPKPKPEETKICVVATGIPADWKLQTTLSEWNLADRYADFVLRNQCPNNTTPQVAITLGNLPADVAAETRFRSYCCDISLVVNRTLESTWIARSTLCHELGHVLGLPHISGTSDTCMTPIDAFYRTRPSKLDTRLVNSYGEWDFYKMYELSGKDVDARSLPK